MKSLAKLSLIILTAAICASSVMAQTESPSTSTNTAPKRARAAFRGTIQSVDSGAMTLTLKGRNTETTVKVTSNTKITKDGQPATFADATAGLRATGSGKKGEDGTWVASTLRISTRPARRAPTPPADNPPSGSSDQKPQ